MEFLSMLKEYIHPQLLVLIPVLVVLGAMLKQSQLIPDQHIPCILGVTGVVLCALYTLSNLDQFTPQSIANGLFTAVVQGFLVAGGAVYSHQLYKQAQQ